MTDDDQQKTVIFVNAAPFIKILKEMGLGGETRALLWEQIGMAVAEFGGVVQRRKRRNMLALWTDDAALEQSAAERAVRAALAMQKVMRGMCVGVVEGEVMPMGIGVCTGAVLLQTDEGNGDTMISGETVEMAQHLGKNAVSKILLDENTFAAVQDVFETEPHAPIVPEESGIPISAHRVLQVKPVDEDGRSMFGFRPTE